MSVEEDFYFLPHTSPCSLSPSLGLNNEAPVSVLQVEQVVSLEIAARQKHLGNCMLNGTLRSNTTG